MWVWGLSPIKHQEQKVLGNQIDFPWVLTVLPRTLQSICESQDLPVNWHLRELRLLFGELPKVRGEPAPGAGSCLFLLVFRPALKAWPKRLSFSHKLCLSATHTNTPIHHQEDLFTPGKARVNPGTEAQTLRHPCVLVSVTLAVSPSGRLLSRDVFIPCLSASRE